ncbi:MAG: MFS transporter [Gemmatimonadetes bacterium]|nr:MFS transporter [Gemmatimonadota bacterium]
MVRCNRCGPALPERSPAAFLRTPGTLASPPVSRPPGVRRAVSGSSSKRRARGAGPSSTGAPTLLTRVRFAVRALRHRNLRLFFSGQGISLVGTWMQQVAMSWLVYRLTGSSLLLGVIAFWSQFPALLLAPVAGALADRWSRYRMVVMAQSLAMLQAVILATLVLTRVVEVWHLVTLALFLGVVSGLDVPARQSLLVRLVAGPEDLPNAIALNSSMFNAARLVGPAIAGILIGLVGEGPVFLLNALSYAAVLTALAAVDVTEERGAPSGGSVLRTVREGFRYAFGFPPIRSILLLLALVSLLGIPYVVLLPVFARDVLAGDARTLGFLTSAAGLGALVGALALASRSSVRGLGRVIALSTGIFGAGLAAFSLSRNLWLSGALLVVVGFGVMTATASMNTVLQTLVDEEMRGRVMSLYTMAFIGMSPIGSLLGGALAVRLGAPATVLLGGSACVLLAAWFARQLPSLREMVRPIYERLGIIPEVATGLQTASELRPKA